MIRFNCGAPQAQVAAPVVHVGAPQLSFRVGAPRANIGGPRITARANIGAPQITARANIGAPQLTAHAEIGPPKITYQAESNAHKVIEARLAQGMDVCYKHPNQVLRQKEFDFGWISSTWKPNPVNNGICPE
jgi:hypothetical protein